MDLPQRALSTSRGVHCVNRSLQRLLFLKDLKCLFRRDLSEGLLSLVGGQWLKEMVPLVR